MTTTEEPGRYRLAMHNRNRYRGRVYGRTTMRSFATPEQRARYAEKAMAGAVEMERLDPWARPRHRASSSRVTGIVAWEGDPEHGMVCARWTPAAGFHVGTLKVRGGRVVGSSPGAPA